MNETELRESLARLADDESPYEVNAEESLRSFRAKRRRRTGFAWSSGIIGVAVVAGVVLAVPALRQATVKEPSAALTAPVASETFAPPDVEPTPETTFDDAAKAAIMQGIKAASPPEWKLHVIDSIPARSGRGWDGWHVLGTADDGLGKGLLGVGVQVGSQKYLAGKRAEMASPRPDLPPGTCPPELHASTTCTATRQPDGRVLLVIRDAARLATLGRVTISVMLIDVDADVMIAARSGNYALPGGVEIPGKENPALATRTNPVYSTDQLTALVLAVARVVEPHVASVVVGR